VNPSNAATAVNSTAGANVCSGTTTILTPVGGLLGPGAHWVWFTGSCGGTQVGTGSSLTVTPLTTTTYYVRAQDAFFTTACASITITVTTGAPTANVVIVNGILNACPSTVAVFSVNPVPGATSYVWSAPTGTTINGLSGIVAVPDTFVTVSFGTLQVGQSGYNLCVYASNVCGSTLSRCTWVRGQLSTPIYQTAPAVVCPNTTVAYSVVPQAGAVTYTWSATGGAIITGNGNPSVTITFPAGYTTGTISVTESMACGNTTAPRTITVTGAPTLPGAISGLAVVCPSSIQTYSIVAVSGASTYSWSVPAGCTFTGSGTSITVTFPANFVSGSICVTAGTACSNSAQRCKTVSTGKLPTPANITGDPISGVCGALYQYSIPALANATLGYTWTIPAGVTVVGPSNSNSITLQFPTNFISGTLSVHGNNDCGAGYDRSTPVYGNPSTPGLISGSASVCNGSVELYSWAPVPGATQYQVFAPVGATILSGNVTTSTFTLIQWGSISGNVSIKAVNGCGVSGTRVLAVAITCRMTSLTTHEEVADVVAYPNPNHGKFNVSIDSKSDRKFMLSIFDQTGRMLRQVEVNATPGTNLQEFDMEGIAAGMYLLRVESDSMETVNKSIVIQ
jgi:hypothetical protein